MSENYGRSPALEALPYLRAAQAKDATDLLEGTPEALERLMARKRLLWAEPTLMEG